MSTENTASAPERHLRRNEAAAYVVEKHKVPCSTKTLAKLACVGSDGPPFRMAGRFPLYPVSGLDAWALEKIGPLVRSTSQARAAATAHYLLPTDACALFDDQADLSQH